MPSNLRVPEFLTALFTIVSSGLLCDAQTIGYVAGAQSLTSFDSSSGAIVNTFASTAGAERFAVAADDSTLYLPGAFVYPGTLDKVSGTTGQILNSLTLQYQPRTLVLSSDGRTAYMTISLGDGGAVLVVDVATLSITGTVISFPNGGPSPGDLALSPDGTTLYVATVGTSPQFTCGTTSICVFDTSTLALKGQVQKLTGYLAISRDGRSL